MQITRRELEELANEVLENYLNDDLDDIIDRHRSRLREQEGRPDDDYWTVSSMNLNRPAIQHNGLYSDPTGRRACWLADRNLSRSRLYKLYINSKKLIDNYLTGHNLSRSELEFKDRFKLKSEICSIIENIGSYEIIKEKREPIIDIF